VASRTRVNVFLALFLPILAIDGFRPINRLHQWLEDRIDIVLDLTGLWQGPWKLFGPDVDKVNLRLSAIVTFADGATATWASPEWQEVSGWDKFIHARQTNYFANILTAGKEPAWEGLCEYLAHSLPHPRGTAVAVAQVVLLLKGAEVPPPETPTPAAPYLAFDAPQPIYTWRPTP